MKITLIILSILNILVTILSSVGLILSYCASTISPLSAPWLSFFALAAPLFVIITILMFLYNVARLNYIAILPLLVLLPLNGKIRSQFNLPIKKEYHATGDILKLTTHNVRCFVDDDWQYAIDSTLNTLDSIKPHIIAFQEFNVGSRDIESLKKQFKDYKYNDITLNKYHNKGIGLAMFSKYPIIESGYWHGMDSTLNMQWADFKLNKDTIRVFNIHLKSNQIDRDDKQMLTNEILNSSNVDSVKKNFVAHIISKFSENTSVRSIQADTIASYIKDSPYDAVVVGDFNDVPFSYSYNKIKGHLNDSFREKGAGYAFSYNELGKLLKIDYILVPKKYEVKSYKSIAVGYSDHNPITVEIIKKK